MSENIKKRIKHMNFRKPKYILPAILYLPILETAYFAIGVFTFDTAGTYDDTLPSIELPDSYAKGDGIGSKYEDMIKTYDLIRDKIENDNYEH